MLQHTSFYGEPSVRLGDEGIIEDPIPGRIARVLDQQVCTVIRCQVKDWIYGVFFNGAEPMIAKREFCGQYVNQLIPKYLVNGSGLTLAGLPNEFAVGSIEMLRQAL